MTNGTYAKTFKQPGFRAFFWTQFLGAFNDNFYKMVVSLVALNLIAGDADHFYIDLITLLFILPSVLFSGYAGHMADVHSKRAVLIAVKIFEILVMGSAIVAFLSARVEPMFVIVFLMGLHAAFFSPAKYGILPEMLPDAELSRGNGLLEMSTFVAIILGTSLSGPIYTALKDRPAWIGLLLTAIAVLGALTSFGIAKVPPAGGSKLLRLNPFGEIWDGIKRLYPDKPLWLTVIGLSYFWFLGALVQLDMLYFGKDLLRLNESHITLLGTFLAVGIGIGSLAAGRLSGDKVELGLVPLGSVAMGISLILLAHTGRSSVLTSAALILLGFSSGLFAVPLNSFLQQRSGRDEKGQLIATNNFLNTLAMALAAGTHWFLATWLQLSPDWVVLILGFLTLLGTLVVLRYLPDYVVRFVLWLLTHTLYRIRVVGEEHIPRRGPALLVSNHVSFVDALLIGATMQRFIRFMLHRDYYDNRWLNWFFCLMKTIPVSATNRREIVQSLKRARAELEKGRVVCIFAEGAISRTGHLMPFKRGFERIVDGLDVPIVPVHLDQLWGSIFSFKDGRFFWKWPKVFPYPVTVSFGAPLPSNSETQQVRQAVLELESNAVYYRRGAQELLHGKFIRTAKHHWYSFCMADTTGVELSFGKALIGSLLFSRWLRKQRASESIIGVVLPASVGGALVNVGILLAGKVVVNLNFTAGSAAMTAAIQQCGIGTILTSRAFLSKAQIEETSHMVFVEEITKSFSSGERVLATLTAFLIPGRYLERHYTKNQKPDSLATVIFSSGSTGTPKGVMLSHHNIISNIESVCQVIPLTPSDRIMGVLPFFHSFGFSVSLWLPLVAGFRAIYHPNPMDAKTIGDTVQKYHATLLISTPTFYAGYMRRCSREQFSSLRYAIAGAERLREQIAKDFKDNYGFDLLEGYGCTELAPVVSVNLPDVIDGVERQVGKKPGSAGHPIPGVAVKIIDPSTERPLPIGQEGLLLVKGANCMLGYLGQPEVTEQVLRDGWYVTGDIASIDEDGFIRITDRLSRFSKIGGEMVPHMKIEEVINGILGNAACVVTAIPDAQKGERLLAIYTDNSITADELWDKLCETELPKLWIPKRENLYPADSIPLLGSGKVDLSRVKAMALQYTKKERR